MPFIHIHSNLSLTEVEKNNCLRTLSSTVAELLSKKEDVVMTAWTASKMTMSGIDSPAAFVELRSIRLQEDQLETLSKELTERINLATGIITDRIFINFVDVAPEKWAMNGKPFA